MQIELIGCTGVGKSTLVKKMLQSCREKGIVASTGDQFVLKQANLDWVRNYIFRTILVDIITLSACLLTFRSNSKFYRLVIEVIHKLPSSVNLFEKLNIIRNTFKKLGTVEIIRYRNSNQQIIFLDEGTIHTAHYVFVQISTAPPMKYLSRFLQLIPLPDVVIYLQQDEAVLVERILARNHRRTHDRSYPSVKAFIKNAVDTFTEIEHQPAVKSKLIIIDDHGDIKTGSTRQQNASIHMTLNLLRDTFKNVDRDKTEYKYG